MAIKAGQILHDANGYVINRIQSAGPGNINIPEEKVYELGNFESVCTIRDTPDLSFDLESLAVSTEMEAIITNRDPTATVNGQEFDLVNFQPVDFISPYKSGTNAFDIVTGVVVPNLTIERASYRFGLQSNASQQFTFRGDSIAYVPGTPYKEVITNTGVGPYSFATTPTISWTESGNVFYAYNITLKNSASNVYKRLFLGTDYTNTSTDFTFTEDLSSTYDEIHVTYGSSTAGTYASTVHKDATVQPCAIRGRDIDIYVGQAAATETLVKWTGVQSFETTWSVQLENDQEFGNARFVSTDFDVAEVTGSIGIKAADPTELFERINNVAGAASNVTVGALNSLPLAVEARLKDPDTGAVVKTFYIEDARFTVPSISGRVQSKLETTFNFSSETGSLKIYEGSR